ncbi:MAG: DoxX family protein, partial [Bacteroidales bacterium]|nr:DoxX family protein [Bacteroidales bacterium]
MKNIAAISRILLGIVFVFSGFVKGIDPLGSTYKFIDYFTAFNLSFLSPLAFILAILMNAAEFLIGVSLILRLRMKVSAWAVFLFMCFFTVLTFILALTNPVSDCGCFGDALVLTNWETFFKNLVLMALALIVFLYRKKYEPVYRPVTEWICVVLIAGVIIGISVYCYRHLPLLDFRPYSVGANIPQGMTIPDGMPTDEFKTTLYYEKDGVVK